jgi:cystathionine gamma-synthase
MTSALLSNAFLNFDVASKQTDMKTWETLAQGGSDDFLYARNTPSDSILAVEKAVSLLEKSDTAIAFSSCMAAIYAALMSQLKPGMTLVASANIYGGSYAILEHLLPTWGVNVVLIPSNSPTSLAKVIQQGCDLVYLETPSNPLLKIQDIKQLSEFAHEQGAKVVVDNTVATPISQQPITLGADIVVHSATKFLSGHADTMGGVVCTSHALKPSIVAFKELSGGCLDPMGGFLIARGMRTLALRMKQCMYNAQLLTELLSKSDVVEAVYYPGLVSHPDHDIATKQMQGYGALFSFNLKGGTAAVEAFVNTFEPHHLRSTLGSVDTLLGLPSTTSHVECTIEERIQLGIPEGLIRCSVGIENTEELIHKFEKALQSIC